MGCSVTGCARTIFAAGLCSRHYNRLRTTGTTDDGPRARLSLSERFWKYVKRANKDECWLWIGRSISNGYGNLSIGGRGGRKEPSHRIAWTLLKGEIPTGQVVRHMCHNRLCCNPAHLCLGTQADNVADMWRRDEGPKGNARLTADQIVRIRKDKRSSRQIAPLYGVTDGHIRSIRNGRCW